MKESRLLEYQQHHQQQQHFSMKQNTPEVYNKGDYFVNIFFHTWFIRLPGAYMEGVGS